MGNRFEEREWEGVRTPKERKEREERQSILEASDQAGAKREGIWICGSGGPFSASF